MKPIKLTEEMKLALFQEVMKKFDEQMNSYGFNTTDANISVKTNFSKQAEEKVVISYTQQAYLRMRELVQFFDSEVAWYGLVEQIDPLHYYVYDVKVCKQYVNGTKVDTEDEDMFEFFSNLTDEEAEHMHFQAHSHVNMSTSASGTDVQNQEDIMKNLSGKGFYIFQIWNKKDDISTYLYDLDNNVFYDSKDVLIDIEGVDDFIVSVADLVQKIATTYPYQGNSKGYTSWRPDGSAAPKENTSAAKKEEKKNEKSIEKDDDYQPSYLPGYYDGDYSYGYAGRGDWY